MKQMRKLPLCDRKDMRSIVIRLKSKIGYLPQDISQTPVSNKAAAGIFERDEAKVIARTVRKLLKDHGIRGSVRCEPYDELTTALEAISQT